MDRALIAFLIAIAVIMGLPAWLTGSILKRRSKEEGGGGTDWVPLGYVVYAFTEFQHPRKFAIVWAYIFSNILSWGAIACLLVHYLKNRG